MTSEQPEKVSFETVYLQELKWIKQRRRGLRTKKRLPDSSDALDAHIPDENPGEDPKRSLHELQTQALQADLCGLAISGGGIRSATFSLGVLQGLAALGLLPRFDYLSTVSGGGYIGAWFSAWVNRDGFDAVEKKLLPPRLQQTPTPEVEAEPIRHLRLYSNYLAPRPGLFSFDGWVLIAIYLRNLLLNQLVLLLAVLGLFVGVRTIVEEFSLAHGPQSDVIDSIVCSAAALVMLLVALSGAALLAPGGCLPRDKRRKFRLFEFWMVCVIPWVFAAFFASLLFVSPSTVQWMEASSFQLNLLKTAAAFGGLHGLLGVLSFRCRWCGLFSGTSMGLIGGMVFYCVWRSLLNMALSLEVTVATVVTLGVPLSLAAFVLTNFLMVGLCGPRLSELEREWWSSVNSRLMMLATAWAALFGIAVVGPWLIGQIWMAITSPQTDWLKLATGTAGAGWFSVLFAGLKAAHGPDTKSTSRNGVKETLTRMAPVMFLVTLFLALAVVTTWLTYDVFAWIHGQDSWRFRERWGMVLVDLDSPKTPLNAGFELPVFWALFLASGCLIGFSRLLGGAVGVNTFSLQNLYANRLVRCYLGASKRHRDPDQVVNMDPADDFELSQLFPGPNFEEEQLQVQSGNADRLRKLIKEARSQQPQTAVERKAQTLKVQSLTAELKRAEQLSSRSAQERFAEKQKRATDNKRSGIEQQEDWGPFHIINGALNQKASAVRSNGNQRSNADETDQERQAENLQFLERQAESFAFTPLYCGSEATGYCRSHEFAGDVKLGTAVAVSGAAVSPNMGYHSSPAVTALLTVFNVRLGAWFGNPRIANTRSDANPAANTGLLLAELAGMTDAKSDYVYVSDGGHFENMGVYELIRRRCRFIVAVDAGADPKFHENVGRVVRQVRIDFGIWIEVDMASVTPGPNGLCASHVVVGRIHYGDVHRPRKPNPNNPQAMVDLEEQNPGDPQFSHPQNHGIIIWIKNSLTGDEPGDLVNHAAMQPAFPYDSTVDQFFSEPQFESYRALGLHSVRKSLFLPGKPPAKTASASRCLGAAQVAPPTRGDHEKARGHSTSELFETIFNFWLTKPSQYVTGYVQENEAYAKIQATLRQDNRLIWLAKELYGTVQDQRAAREAYRKSRGVAERLMVNEMFTFLENVFLMLDLERNSEHPVHSGWKGVFDHWVGAPSFRKYWADQTDDPDDSVTKGLCHEYCPAFRRFIDQLMDQKQGDA